MKKLAVLLLAFVMVGAAFAQVTTSVSLSGAVYLERMTDGSGNIIANVSNNGSGYDVLKFKAANKDNTYGFQAYDNNILDGAALTVDYWDVWYKFGMFKATLGKLNGGSYTQDLVNGWLGNYGPTDNIAGKGILFELGLVEGFSLGVFYPASGGAAVDALKTSVIGMSYTTTCLSLKGQVNLGLVASNTSANVGIDYTGIPKLDAYGFADYLFASTGVFTYGAGIQYKETMWRLSAEFEGKDAVYDISGQFRVYPIAPLYIQVRPYVGSSGRTAVRGMVGYNFGNGFNIEGMLGFDTAPTAGWVTLSGVADKVIHYVRLGYGISF